MFPSSLLIDLTNLRESVTCILRFGSRTEKGDNKAYYTVSEIVKELKRPLRRGSGRVARTSMRTHENRFADRTDELDNQMADMGKADQFWLPSDQEKARKQWQQGPNK